MKKYINIFNMEDLLISKDEIITYLLENNKITENMNIEEFIKYINPNKYVYLYQNDIIAFNIINIDETKYIYITSEKNLDKLQNMLEQCEFNLLNLHKMSIAQMLSENFKTTNKIIMNNEYYML